MDLKAIKEQINEHNIDTIRLDFSDLYGICRSKIFPARRLEETVEEGLNFVKAIFSVNLQNDVCPGTGCGEEVDWEDMNVRPDPSTFVVMPHQNNTARMIGDCYSHGEPLLVAPRQVLKRVLQRYEEKGLRAVAASELEFYLFKAGSKGQERYSTRPTSVYQMNPRVDHLDMMRTLQNMFCRMGLDIIYLNHEFFPSQYEVNWKYDQALAMADQTFTFKYICKEVAFQNDLTLTFMARPRNDAGGSGYHVHMSLSDPKTRQNLFNDPQDPHGLAEIMKWFIGGQIAHARGMSAIVAPTVNSYKRYVPNSFAPYNVAWGLDNRTVYVRVPHERGPGTRVENRAPCATANPYLTIAACLAAGLDGIEKKIDPGEPFVGDCYTADTSKYPPLPMYLQEALEELNKDVVLCQALGPKLIQAFNAVKQAEVARFRTYVTEWEYCEYAYHL
ncbi:MAG: glutamine synthetase family protein [Thermodesulfobacteriota bacterium]